MMQLSESTNILPWQQPQWTRLTSMFNAGHLPHALLLHGTQGVGKQHLAKLFATYLLCSDKQATSACGQCKECLLVKANSHPDFLLLQPEDTGKAIKIDAIRQLLYQFTQKSHHSGYKVALIHPAEAMNRSSANALLKTLEEPGEQTMIMLLSDNASLLPATIRSRCQAIYFPSVDKADTEAFLRQQGLDGTELDCLSHFCQGAPLQALSLDQSEQLQQRQQLFEGLVSIFQQQLDPINLAQSCYRYELRWLLQCFIKWTVDIIRWQFGQQKKLYNNDYKQMIADIANQCSEYKFHQLLDKLNQAQQLVNSSINPNSQLLLEDLFCRWSLSCRHMEKDKG